MAALQTNLEYFIKRGDPQQCLLKLTEQDCCSSYKYLEVVREGSCSLLQIEKLIEQFMKYPLGMMPCACCWSVGNHNHFQERKPHSNFFEWRRFAQWKMS